MKRMRVDMMKNLLCYTKTPKKKVAYWAKTMMIPSVATHVASAADVELRRLSLEACMVASAFPYPFGCS
jgi:hypothetical protein